MDKQKVLKKIAKCLELANSGNINEAANAIKMAHRLMLKYGLNKDDIDFIKMGRTKSTHLLPSAITSMILRIIRGINSKFKVEAILLNHKGLKQVEFIGEADRAIFAAFAFDVTYRAMKENVGQFKNTLLNASKLQTEITKRVNSFSSGWIEGALEKLPTLDTDEATNSKINSYIDKEFEKIDRETFKRQLKQAMQNLTNDYDIGLKKGRKISINRGVGSANVHKIELPYKQH